MSYYSQSDKVLFVDDEHSILSGFKLTLGKGVQLEFLLLLDSKDLKFIERKGLFGDGIRLYDAKYEWCGISYGSS